MRIVDKEKVYSFVDGLIDDTIADAQERICLDAPYAFKDWIKRGIENGKYRLCRIECDGQKIGSVTWMVQEAKFRELVVIHAISSRPDLSISHLIELFARTKAKEENCVSVCCHTLRRGLVKNLHSLGWHVSEIVLRKNL